jgi:hypothetical protein
MMVKSYPSGGGLITKPTPTVGNFYDNGMFDKKRRA